MVRKIIQIASTLVMNANLSGLATGRIWQGRSKRVCVPGLNCYSCPAALGACPLGALQMAIASFGVAAMLYVVGMLMIAGVIFGRVVCGFLCPFGLVQELISLPLMKLKINRFMNRFKSRFKNNLKPHKNLNYIFLIIFVFLFPLIAYASTGLGSPAFCKYICAAGTLQAGVPLMLLDARLRDAVGILHSWKIFLALCMIIACAFIYRPFCRICPLGAIYGLFNKIALVGMAVDENKCTNCGGCKRSSIGCPMQTYCTSNGCIRCGKCTKKCPSAAIKFELRFRNQRS